MCPPEWGTELDPDPLDEPVWVPPLPPLGPARWSRPERTSSSDSIFCQRRHSFSPTVGSTSYSIQEQVWQNITHVNIMHCMCVTVNLHLCTNLFKYIESCTLACKLQCTLQCFAIPLNLTMRICVRTVHHCYHYVHYPITQFHISMSTYTKNTATCRSTMQRHTHRRIETYLSVSADFDWFVIVPRVLEVHTHRELQATSAESRRIEVSMRYFLYG